MKRCSQCQRTYVDDSLRFCLDDGAPLVATSQTDPGRSGGPATRRADPPPTEVLPPRQQAKRQTLPSYVYILVSVLVGLALLVVIAAAGILLWLRSGSRSGSGAQPSPSPYARRTGGTENSRSPQPSPTVDTSTDPLTTQIWGTWTWTSFEVTYLPGGTGVYKNGNDLCFNFKYEVSGGVLHMTVVGKQQCGPSGLDYRISINGDNLHQEYTGNGYVTEWKRVR